MGDVEGYKADEVVVDEEVKAEAEVSEIDTEVEEGADPSVPTEVLEAELQETEATTNDSDLEG